jgi:hypothetical protein
MHVFSQNWRAAGGPLIEQDKITIDGRGSSEHTTQFGAALRRVKPIPKPSAGSLNPVEQHSCRSRRLSKTICGSEIRRRAAAIRLNPVSGTQFRICA